MSESKQRLEAENFALRKRIAFLLGVIIGLANGDEEATAVALAIVRDANAHAEPRPDPGSAIFIP